MITEEDINKAYMALAQTKQGLYSASLRVIEAQRVLAERKIELFKEGMIDGKNEETRKAQIIEFTVDEIDAVNKAEDAVRAIQVDHELVSYEVARLRMIIDWTKGA